MARRVNLFSASTTVRTVYFHTLGSPLSPARKQRRCVTFARCLLFRRESGHTFTFIRGGTSKKASGRVQLQRNRISRQHFCRREGIFFIITYENCIFFTRSAVRFISVFVSGGEKTVTTILPKSIIGIGVELFDYIAKLVEHSLPLSSRLYTSIIHRCLLLISVNASKSLPQAFPRLCMPRSRRIYASLRDYELRVNCITLSAWRGLELYYRFFAGNGLAAFRPLMLNT